MYTGYREGTRHSERASVRGIYRYATEILIQIVLDFSPFFFVS